MIIVIISFVSVWFVLVHPASPLPATKRSQAMGLIFKCFKSSFDYLNGC